MVGKRPRAKTPPYRQPFLATEAANQVWCADFKGQFRTRDRRCCYPFTVSDLASRYLLCCDGYLSTQAEGVKASLIRVFREHGLPEAIRSDNGAPFASRNGILGLSRLSAWWLVLGIDLERSRPGCPQDNPAHERLHLDVRREIQDYPVEVEQAGLDQWRTTYNQERPHEALQMRCPAQLYQSSNRKYEGTPEDLSYPAMESRKVANSGTITWARQQWIFISGALAGWSVGLEPATGKGGCWNVWFGRLLLGEIEEKTLRFQRTEPAVDPPNRQDQMATSSKGVE